MCVHICIYICMYIYPSATRTVGDVVVKAALCRIKQHCNTLQHTATHCNTLQHTATHYKWHTSNRNMTHTTTHCNTFCRTCSAYGWRHCGEMDTTSVVPSGIATQWNKLQSTTTQYNTPLHAATRLYTLQHTATHCIRHTSNRDMTHTTRHCNTHCNTL